jgi:hypothetical protein
VSRSTKLNIFLFVLFGVRCFGPLLIAEELVRSDWWSLQPLKVQEPSAGSPSVDAYLSSKLKKQNLRPSPKASPRVQVRRLYFDLIGMPPTPGQISAFEKNPSDTAYRAMVDDLLSSAHYGERWGRHWLDVARFGESDGFERNNPRNNLWPFRDWVIKALNADMPYDEFVRMQIAGDLLKPDAEGKAAVAFLAAGLHNTVVGGSEFMKKTARQDELEEIAGAVGQTFVGLTINCARCHDHKYDPISQKEYYQLTSALGGVFHGEQQVKETVDAGKLAKIEKTLKDTDAAIAKIEMIARTKVLAARKSEPDASRHKPPKPYASWEFDDDLRDSTGKLHGEAVGAAHVVNGALVLNGRDAYVKTVPLAKDIGEKTLEAWAVLQNLNQRGGSLVSLQTLNGNGFDAIVFGERTPRAWMAGSDGFRRSKLVGGPVESEADKKPVHVAIVYRSDGTITRYRNGVPYDRSYRTGFVKYAKGSAHVIFGLRHGTSAGGGRMLEGRILRAQLYDRALSPEAVAASAGVESDFVSEVELVAALDAEKSRERLKLVARAGSFREEANRLNVSGRRTIYTVAARGNPGVTHVLNRGHALQPREAVKPGAVAAVSGLVSDFGLSENASDADRRRKLAEWIWHRVGGDSK